MKYEIVELEEKYVKGIGVKTTNENGQSMKDIGILWQKFFQDGIYTGIQDKVNGKTIGLYADYEGDYTKPYQFVVGAEVDKQTKQEITKVIPKGKYAKFVIIGDVQKEVAKLWDNIWKMDLKRKYTCDFEEYQEIIAPNKQEIHVYIAID